MDQNQHPGPKQVGPESAPTKARKPARLWHKKSRTGCQQCRARRVKCSEDKPTCRACQRFGLPCAYDPNRQAKYGMRVDHDQLGVHALEPAGDEDAAGVTENASDVYQPHDERYASSSASPAEPVALHLDTDSKRRLELHLLHHYIVHTGPSIVTTKASRLVWTHLVPELAVQWDSVLYAMCAVSALHNCVLKSRGNWPILAGSLAAFQDEENYMHTYHHYVSMAVEQHARDIEARQPGDKAAGTALATTSGLLRVFYLGELQRRILHRPRDGAYTPPVTWLRTTASSSTLCRQVYPLLQDDPSSIMGDAIRGARVLKGQEDTDAVKAQYLLEFPQLLLRDQNYNGGHLMEDYDTETREAYVKMATDLGRAWRSVLDKDPVQAISWRLLALPMDISKRFIDLIEECEPRALVMLAYYFAMLSKLRDIWWVGEAGPREVQAIAQSLPPEWQHLMAWPLRMLSLDVIPAASIPTTE